jgi:hypothetical protein
MPTIDPAAAADAVPVAIDELDIDIDHTGDYRIPLGTATIPTANFRRHPSDRRDLWVVPRRGRPAAQCHIARSIAAAVRECSRPWLVSRVEEVSVALEFTILRADAGAVLSIADVVVR